MGCWGLGAGHGDLHRHMCPGLCNIIAVSKEPWNIGSIERGFGLQWGLLHLWPTHPCCNHYWWCHCTSTSKKIIELFDFVVFWLIRHEKSSVSLLCTYVTQLVHGLLQKVMHYIGLYFAKARGARIVDKVSLWFVKDWSSTWECQWVIYLVIPLQRGLMDLNVWYIPY
jgi:hypothetical protein